MWQITTWTHLLNDYWSSVETEKNPHFYRMQNRGKVDFTSSPRPMLLTKLRKFIHMLCILRIQNMVRCAISYQNTKYTIQIMISVSIGVFDCYGKFIVTVQLTIRLGSTFKHQKVPLYKVAMYRYFGEMCCLHLQLPFTLTEVAVFFPPKRPYTCT
jgi:hypothetical protein